MRESNWVSCRISLISRIGNIHLRVFLALALAGIMSILSSGSFAQTLTLRSAAVLVESSLGTTKNTTTLPFRWDTEHPGENGRVTYTLGFASIKSPELQSIFIPRVGNQVQIWVNGSHLYSGGALDDALRDFSQTPLLISLPTQLLKDDEPNTLVIKTSVQALRWAGLSQVYVGSERELCHAYDWAVLWQRTSYIVILATLVFMGLLSFFIWLKQKEPLYLYFVWSAVSGSVVLLDHLLTQFALSWPLHGITAGVALAWHVIFMSRFALEIAGRRERWVTLSMLASTIAVGIAYVLAEPVYWTITMAMLCLPVVAALICTAKAADAQRSGPSRGLFLVSLLVAAAALRDFFVVQWPDSGISEFVLLPHALFLFTVVMAVVLIRRYTHQHELYHALNLSLEQRVSEREAQLQQSFDQLQVQGEERAKLLERQRIMSDIHDGVGGQLVGLVNMIKRRPEAGATLLEHAQLALDELRASVDAMQPVDGDFSTVLATLRYRLAPRLIASGIALVWQVEDLPKLDDLSPQKVLQIQKILLEAFTNVMRHAKATEVTVSAKAANAVNATSKPAQIEIEIVDNGIGFDFAGQALGHGLGNMQFRATAIGASLAFERISPHGMRVRLIV